MTLTDAPRTEAGERDAPAPPPRVRHPAAAVIALVAGCVLLVARPPLLTAGGDPVATLVAVFMVLFVVGRVWPTTTSSPRGLRRSAAVSGKSRQTSRRTTSAVLVLALGLAAFALGRLLGGGEAPYHVAGADLARLVALNSLAAVAEEAFFRRFAYAVLLPSGTAAAVAGSATLFALVHVTIYGWWVLPLDLAAGLVLAWQRHASGSWRVPALTHVVANVLVVL